jgi:hypothetical protein
MASSERKQEGGCFGLGWVAGKAPQLELVVGPVVEEDKDWCDEEQQRQYSERVLALASALEQRRMFEWKVAAVREQDMDWQAWRETESAGWPYWLDQSADWHSGSTEAYTAAGEVVPGSVKMAEEVTGVASFPSQLTLRAGAARTTPYHLVQRA